MNPAETTLTIHAKKVAVDFLEGDATAQTLFERDGGKVHMHFDEMIVAQINPSSVKVTLLWQGKPCAEMAVDCALSSGANLYLLGIEGRVAVTLG